jgi:hypothetical protein
VGVTVAVLVPIVSGGSTGSVRVGLGVVVGSVLIPDEVGGDSGGGSVDSACLAVVVVGNATIGVVVVM